MKKNSTSLIALLLSLMMFCIPALAGCSDDAPPASQNAGTQEKQESQESVPEEEDLTDYPQGPISAICPWSAGGASDIAFRTYLNYIAEELGADINVQNVTGGDGSIGIAQALAAPADGYMIAMLNYDLLSNEIKGITEDSYQDFALIDIFTLQGVNLIVRSDSGWDTFDDFIQAAKAAKAAGKTLQIGINGFWLHAAGMMADAAGITDCVTFVPSDGSSVLMTELLGGHVDAVTSSVSVAIPHLESGDMKILGTMSETRMEKYPDVPTFKEMGYDVVIAGFRALGVHQDTPQPIVDRLREAAKVAYDNPDFQKWATESSIDQVYMDAEESRIYLESLYPSVESTMKKLGLI
ncbi:MAG: tripartite tricarboxylate transporter substrate binding protein [Peptococcaceae bacterium]|nr:tripartite tricarboxylate transporter substrate binding protein [Peptococcaceae bacterium]